MKAQNRQTLQNITNELCVISPQIQQSILFNPTGTAITANDTSKQKQTQTLLSGFQVINEQAKLLGDIENLAIQGSQRQLQVCAVGNWHLATVTSRDADQRILKSLTTVWVPTILGLIEQTQTPLVPQQDKKHPPPIQNSAPNPVSEPQAAIGSTTVFSQVPVSQFLVEKIGGLLVPSDTVRVDSDTAAGWSRLYEGKLVTHVTVETLERKAVTCKYRAFKSNKATPKGIIQIPEKLLQALQTGKGELVMVKPVVEG